MYTFVQSVCFFFLHFLSTQIKSTLSCYTREMSGKTAGEGGHLTLVV